MVCLFFLRRCGLITFLFLFFSEDDVSFFYGFFFLGGGLRLDYLNKKKKKDNKVETHNALNHFNEAVVGRVRYVCTKN